MKKFFFTLLLMGGAFHSYAQGDVVPNESDSSPKSESYSDNRKFGLGITAGYNASTYSDNQLFAVGSGFNVGVTGLFMCLQSHIGHLVVEPSILYSRECLKLDLDEVNSIFSHDEFLIDDGYSSNEVSEKNYNNFLKIPVQCGYEFKLGSKITLGPKVGLEYARRFDKDMYDVVFLNLVEGVNLNYKRKLRLSLGWQSNIRAWDLYDGYNGHQGSESYKSDYVNFNANIAYLFF